MAFSKAVLLVVFAILLISSEVLAHRDLAETTNTPTTDHDARASYPGVAINPGRSVSCNRGSKKPCQSSGGKGGNGVPDPKCKNPTTRECYGYGNGGKGGKGGNGGKGGRGGHGPETEN